MRITNTTMKILAILLGGLFITAIGSAGSVTFTGAEQQVGLGIGYKADDADHPLIEQLYPVPPQGLGMPNSTSRVSTPTIVFPHQRRSHHHSSRTK